MPAFSCSVILFDLDGVLVDSTRSVDRQWRIWSREHGIEEEKVVAIAHGVRTIEVIRTFAPQLDAEAEVRKLEEREAADHDGVVVMPGAVDAVRAIPAGRWCVVTSGTRRLATARLQLAGIPLPAVLITADDVVHGKPHPEPYLKAAELLGFAPAECLVIEDAFAGIRAAQGAGMKVIGFAGTYGRGDLREADAVVSGFAHLQVSLEKARLQVRVGSSTVASREKFSTVREATSDDIPAIVALTNAAFAVEKFIEGTRTDDAGVTEMMSRGVFLLGLAEAQRLVASVYVEVRGARGYFGMLAVDPARQGQGIGRAMVRAAEDYCRARGCTAMDLTTLSLRPELPPIYRRLGYVETGTEEFHPSRPLKNGVECYCIVMSREL